MSEIVLACKLVRDFDGLEGQHSTNSHLPESAKGEVESELRTDVHGNNI
jgi:hypothetical protein